MTSTRAKAKLLFLVRFLVLVTALVGVTFTDVFESRIYTAYVQVNAVVSAWVLNVFGGGVHVAGSVIQGQDVSLHIGRGCTAIEPTAFVIAALLAAPLAWRRRLWVCLRGVLILGVANVARIVSLYVINGVAPEAFDSAHHEVWPLIIIAVAGVVVFVSLERFGDAEASDGDPQPEASPSA